MVYKMPQKTPEDFSLFTYMWVLGLSVWAGISSHFYHMKIDNKAFSFFAFITDICISGFVGLLTFFFCEASNIEPLLTAVIVGISSHMGARAISLFQAYFIRKYFPKHCERCKID
jgi:hypothetical protein